MGRIFHTLSFSDFSQYLAFVNAKNFYSAIFDPGVKEFIKCAVSKVNADGGSKIAACETQVPAIVPPGSTVEENIFHFSSTLRRAHLVSCATRYLLCIKIFHMRWTKRIKSWGVQTTLSLAYHERAAVAPEFDCHKT